jgi:RNA polymerase sigma-70 factor (ECF subfamily)
MTVRDPVDSMIDRAVRGDDVAVQELLARFHPVVVRYCRSRIPMAGGSIASADDVAQEVCLAILTALPSYRQGERPFVAFVYGIARHKVADARRAAVRSHSTPMAELPDGPTGERGPEQHALAGSATVIMNDLLDRLTDTQQEILRLRVVVGLSADATAEAMGMTAGAVRVAQHRALAKMRVFLADNDQLSGLLV